MKGTSQHSRIWKVMKWCGLAVTVVLCGVFFASPWWLFSVDAPSGAYGWIGSGTLSFGHSGMTRDAWLVELQRDYPFQFTRWWFGFSSAPAGTPIPGFSVMAPPGTPVPPWPARWRVDVPLWFPAAASAGITWLVWKAEGAARGRARDGKCPKCGYDLTGLARGAACPECGKISGG